MYPGFGAQEILSVFALSEARRYKSKIADADAPESARGAGAEGVTARVERRRGSETPAVQMMAAAELGLRIERETKTGK